MSSDRPDPKVDELLEVIDSWVFYGSIASTIVLIIVYFLISVTFKTYFSQETLNLFTSIITNMIPTLITFSCSYFVLRKVQKIRNEQSEQRLVHLIRNSLPQPVTINTPSSSIIDQSAKKARVLLISAAPSDSPPIQFDTEIRSIRDGLRFSRYGSSFELIMELSTRKSELQAYILTYKPDILHFYTLSTNQGIILEDEERKAVVLSKKEICSLLSSFSRTISLVILNCSHTGIGSDLSKYIDYVIESKADLWDSDANDFSTSFYNALASEMDVATAYELGCARISQGRSEYELHKPAKDNYKVFVTST